MSEEFFKRLLSTLVLVPLSFFFIINGSHYFNFFILILFIISAYEWLQLSKKNIYKISGIFFLILSFYTVYCLRNQLNGDYLYFILILLICVSTDIGGYIFGKLFRGPKLTKISPKKTYAGALGGYFCSTIFVFVFLNYSNFTQKTSIIFNLSDQKINIFIFLFIIIISTISQLGDIIISYFKRKNKIKNTGKIIPGHGGLLDRIDGMIFAFPIAYIILRIF